MGPRSSRTAGKGTAVRTQLCPPSAHMPGTHTSHDKHTQWLLLTEDTSQEEATGLLTNPRAPTGEEVVPGFTTSQSEPFALPLARVQHPGRLPNMLPSCPFPQSHVCCPAPQDVRDAAMHGHRETEAHLCPQSSTASGEKGHGHQRASERGDRGTSDPERGRGRERPRDREGRSACWGAVGVTVSQR